ncbi:MAG: type II toxin-antitoxin system HicA family toxin [Candidatus Micrarchaeota archaeon]
MPKLPVLSGPELIKLALERGFVIERQKRSHVILSRGERLTVIPVHGAKPLKKGLTLQILKDLGITRKESSER